MRYLLVFYLLLFSWFVFVPRASAEESGGEIKKEYVTQADLDALKDILDEQIKRGLISKYPVNFSGFGILGYSSFQDKFDNYAISSVGLTFAGNLREDPVREGDLKYRVGLLYPGTVTVVPLTDIILIWDLKTGKTILEPAFTSSLTFGQQLVPFGQDNLATEDKIPTIKKAQYLTTFGISRDIGVKIEGGLINRLDPASNILTPLFAFTLATFNGAGSNKADDNGAKDYVAKIIFSPVKKYFSFFRGLKFGGSIYDGKAGAKETVKRRIGAEFEWLRKPFLVTAEYVKGKDDQKESLGYLATLFWTPGTLPDFQPLVRWDRFDPDKNKNGDRIDLYTVGFNYFFYQVEPLTRRVYETLKSERVVKLQVNYNIKKEEVKQVKNNELVVQAVFNF